MSCLKSLFCYKGGFIYNNKIIIMEYINSEIRAFLGTFPNDQQLTDFINNLSPQLNPTLKWHQLNPEHLKELTLVYAHLMVQDIRDEYYYYSFIMKRPLNGESEYLLYKYGNKAQQLQPQEEDEMIQSQKYIKVMTDRSPFICTPVRYQTKWVDELQGSVNTISQIQLLVDGRKNFKLGDIINIVAFYQPEHNKLYYLRAAQPTEVSAQCLDPLQHLLNPQINFQATRQELLHFLCQYAQQEFCQYLLMTLLSEQPLFLGCEDNIAALIQQLHPRVCNLQLKHPCNQSLFPYKNQEGVLIMQPLQLSNLSTFVVIDFSKFSSSSKVLLNQQEICNFKALKIFVEEAKTIYRWQIGQSLLEHLHIGLIVKGTTILNPHFNPKNQKIKPNITNFTLSKQILTKFRSYLITAISISPKLNSQQRSKIEKALFQQTYKQKIGNQLSKVMQLSKLISRSYGRKDMIFSDFERACHLVVFDQQK